MTKKRTYTQMHTSLRRAAKASGKTHDTLLEEVQSSVKKGSIIDTTRAIAAGVEYDTEKGRGLHVFMQDGQFCDWLAECAKTLDPAIIPMVAEGLASQLICLHFPTEIKRPSAVIALMPNDQVFIGFSMDAPWGGGSLLSHFKGQDADTNTQNITGEPGVWGENEPDPVRVKYAHWYTRLVAGLGLYMKTFPHCVYDGIPEDAKHKGWFKNLASRTLFTTSEVVCTDGVTPHYRSGHFRLLTAERYVKKRGQVVFVRGTFVKGQAKTIVEI